MRVKKSDGWIERERRLVKTFMGNVFPKLVFDFSAADRKSFYYGDCFVPLPAQESVRVCVLSIGRSHNCTCLLYKD